MSVIYCEKHDRQWDSDFLSECPLCENESIASQIKDWLNHFKIQAQDGDLTLESWHELREICRLATISLDQTFSCVCGKPTTLGVVHRADRPCFLYADDPMPEPLEAEKKLHALYVAWLTGDPKHLVFVAAKTFQAAAQGAPK